jgi:D-alanyl-lipoteichoic acid acyltransferase DltB (MBOAT superfamily)
MWRVFRGLFKKIVIADHLALVVDYVYQDPTIHSGPTLLLATYFFAYQIYCDFSGYTDIAIGSAQVMGFDLVENFRRPYYSKSIGEFWQRWHISLSTWFRDYLYFPLGGNRVARARWFANLMIVFVVSGLWHGANWTFLVWGALHGTYLLLGIVSRNVRERVGAALRIRGRARAALQVLITFHLVTFAWIFFRANSLADAWFIVTHLGTEWRPMRVTEAALGLPTVVAVAGIVVLEGVHLIQRGGSARLRLSRAPLPVRWLAYAALVYAVILFGARSPEQFIYFQF